MFGQYYAHSSGLYPAITMHTHSCNHDRNLWARPRCSPETMQQHLSSRASLSTDTHLCTIFTWNYAATFELMSFTVYRHSPETIVQQLSLTPSPCFEFMKQSAGFSPHSHIDCLNSWYSFVEIKKKSNLNPYIPSSRDRSRFDLQGFKTKSEGPDACRVSMLLITRW